MDGSSTPYVLGNQLLTLSFNKCEIFETVQITNVNAANWRNIKQTFEELKNEQRGEWSLRTATSRWLKPSFGLSVASNCGFIVFKDRTTAIFYTNRLA